MHSYDMYECGKGCAIGGAVARFRKLIGRKWQLWQSIKAVAADARSSPFEWLARVPLDPGYSYNLCWSAAACLRLDSLLLCALPYHK